MSSVILTTPAGFIDPALADARELETLRTSVQDVTGSIAAATGERPPAGPAADDRTVAALHWLRHMLEANPHGANEIGIHLVITLPHGPQQKIAMPTAWGAEWLHELSVLLSGNPIHWAVATPEESHDEIGTKEAAEILGVSVPTAQKVLDRGDLPFRLTPGGHRRVRRRDVEQWRARRDVQRQSLQALVQMAKEDETTGLRLPSNVTEDPMDES